MRIWRSMVAMAAGVMAGCGPAGPLEVKTTHLREVSVETSGEPMVRAEQMRRMRGAIGLREQEQRLGHYFTALWRDEPGGEPVRVVLEYQQAATASLVKKLEQRFAGEEVEGRAEFQVVGDAYLKGGRVLAWKCTVFRGSREVAAKQSYLWD